MEPPCIEGFFSCMICIYRFRIQFTGFGLNFVQQAMCAPCAPTSRRDTQLGTFPDYKDQAEATVNELVSSTFHLAMKIKTKQKFKHLTDKCELCSQGSEVIAPTLL